MSVHGSGVEVGLLPEPLLGEQLDSVSGGNACRPSEAENMDKTRGFTVKQDYVRPLT